MSDRSERDDSSRRMREKRANAKDVAVPPCADPTLRARLEADDEQWLRHIFPEIFWYEFTSQQKIMIAAIAHAIRHGGDQAIAASRGEGKTTYFETVLMKYTLQGIVKFAVLFAATSSLAEASLETIKSYIAENDRLCALYPEVCVPVRELEDTPQRAHFQTVSGIRHDNGEAYVRAQNKFVWCGQQIVLPRVPGSPSAGAIFATRGLEAPVRGIKRLGRRPDVCGIDDPDTEETVRSEDQAKKLEERIDKAIAALGSQTRPVARVMLTTLQSLDCVSAKFTDPQQKPSWKGRRFKFLLKPPTNVYLWDQYIAAAQADWQPKVPGGPPIDAFARRAHNLYLANRAAMDEGAEVANPNRFDATLLPDGSQTELSALQHYHNWIARTSVEAVRTEYDNDPPPEEGVERLVLTSYHIRMTCRSGLERRVVPDGTVALTVGGDVQKLGLHWVAIAWNEQAVGVIVDYDFYPFTGTEGKAASACEVLVLEGLLKWWDGRTLAPFVESGGDRWEPDLTLIDSGWKEDGWNSQPVNIFCSQAGFSQCLPSKGQSPYRAPKTGRAKLVGDNWHVAMIGGVPLAELNADHWKLKVHEAFLAAAGEPGSLSLWNPERPGGRENINQHLAYSKHVLAESWETRAVPGFRGSKTGWWKSGNKPNHWLDATAQAIAARAMWGIHTIRSPVSVPPSAGASEPVVAATPSRSTTRSW